MNQKNCVWSAGIAILFAGLSIANTAWSASPASHVVIISIDGGKPAVMQKTQMPVLGEMIAGGAVSWSARTVFPSYTLPSHVSMLTGVGPDKHGVLWNDWEPERGFVKVPTVFSQAKLGALKTIFVSGKDKLKHLNVPGTVDTFTVVEGGALAIGEQAAAQFKESRPELMFVHFPDADSAGHTFGWGSGRQRSALERVDQGVGKLREAVAATGLNDRTLFVVTADHGGTFLGHGSNSDSDQKIPWVAFGAAVRKGIELKAAIQTQDTAATVAWALGLVPIPGAEGRVVTEAFE